MIKIVFPLYHSLTVIFDKLKLGLRKMVITCKSLLHLIIDQFQTEIFYKDLKDLSLRNFVGVLLFLLILFNLYFLNL